MNKTYEILWRNKWLTADAKTLKGMASALRKAANRIEALDLAGFRLDKHSAVSDDYASIVTTDPKAAKKWGAVERQIEEVEL